MFNLKSRLSNAMPEALKIRIERREEAGLDSRRLADASALAELERRLESCDQIDQYLEFARDVFALNQIPEEISGLMQLLQDAQPKVAGEIGTFRCGNLFLMRHSVPSVETLVGVDRVLRQKGLFRHLGAGKARIHLIEGESRGSRTVSAVSKALDGRNFDFLMIDGDHTYDGVKADFLHYRRFVREGGLIAFHDIVPDLTTRMKSATRLSKCYSGGVPIFWNEIKGRYPHQEFVASQEQDGFGIGVITYSSSIDPGP